MKIAMRVLTAAVLAAGSMAYAEGLAPRVAESTLSAVADQQIAENKLDALSKELRRQAELAQLVNRLRTLITTQQGLITETKTAGDPGREITQVSPEIKGHLQGVAGRQQGVAQDVTTLRNDLVRTAAANNVNNPRLGSILRNAAGALDEAKVSGVLESASQEIGGNHTNAAGDKQLKGLAGLLAAEKILQGAEQYEHTIIALKAAKLLEEVTLLRDAQVATLKDVKKNDGAALLPLGDRENNLNMSLVGLRARAGELPDGQKIAGDLKDAQVDMQQATGALYTREQPPAVTSEGAAVTSLNLAISKLQAMVNRYSPPSPDLAAVRAQFEAARALEIEFRDAVAGMERHRASLGALPSVDVDQLHGLAGRQAKLADGLHALAAEKLTKFDEFMWVTGQVTDLMTESRDRMSHDETGSEVQRAQDGAITRLTSIIDALREEEAQIPRFVTDPGPTTTPGSATPGKPPLILPLAELKMLRMLEQIDVDETVALNKALAVAKTDEDRAALRHQVEVLGDDQKKVSELAQRVIGRIR